MISIAGQLENSLGGNTTHYFLNKNRTDEDAFTAISAL
jgi:hypothetical protein